MAADLSRQSARAWRDGGALLAAVARAVRHRRLEARQSAHRVERDEEHPLEGGDPRPRIRRRPSSGAIGSSSCRRCRSASPAPLRMQPRGGIQPRDRYRFVVLAIDRRTGKHDLGADGDAKRQPHEASHQDNGTYASSSAITDGRRVYAWFESQGMYVYDMDGDAALVEGPRRQDRCGISSAKAAPRSSPAIASSSSGITSAGSFVVALDAANGRELWRQSRDEIDTWATPLVVEQGGRAAGDRAREEQDPQLRSRDRRDRLGEHGHDDEPDSIAGVRRRHGLRHQRISGQQPQGDPPGERARATSPARTRSSGRSNATRRTCRRRCSTTACSIC